MIQMLIVRVLIFSFIAVISCALIGVFSWYSYSDWQTYYKYTKYSFEVYQFRHVYGNNNQSVGGLAVAVCLDNSTSPVCSDTSPRCYGTAIDLYGNFDLSFNEPSDIQTTDDILLDRYDYWCGDVIPSNSDDYVHNCTASSLGNTTYYGYILSDNSQLILDSVCPSPTNASETMSCCTFVPGEYAALRRSIGGTFVIVVFSIVFAIISFAGLFMSCYLDEKTAYNVYTIGKKII